MLARARRAGWEGIIAKRTDARYRPGARSDDWLKLKLQFRAEFRYDGSNETVYLGDIDDAGDQEFLDAQYTIAAAVAYMF